MADVTANPVMDTHASTTIPYVISMCDMETAMTDHVVILTATITVIDPTVTATAMDQMATTSGKHEVA
jgi:hypothetical protein